jgi:hypothetical protein
MFLRKEWIWLKKVNRNKNGSLSVNVIKFKGSEIIDANVRMEV